MRRSLFCVELLSSLYINIRLENIRGMHFLYLIKQQSLFSVVIIISSAMEKRVKFLNRNHILFLKTVQYIRHLRRNFVRRSSIQKLTTARVRRL